MKAEIYKDELGKEYEVTDIPEDMMDMAQEWREKLVESVAECDEELMMKFLEGEEITIEEMKDTIRKQTIACQMVPMLCGSAYRNKGVQMMLDAVIDYMPAPIDIPPIKGVDPDTGEEDVRKSSDSEPFSALAFKIMADPFVGKLAFFRVYSGTLESGSYVYNSTKGKKEKESEESCRCMQIKREEIEKVYSGDIAAAVGLKDTTTGDTLFATTKTRLYWNPWNSQILLLKLQSSLRQKLVSRRWVLPLRSWQKKIRLLRLIQMKTLGRPSSPEWANFIWKSS